MNTIYSTACHLRTAATLHITRYTQISLCPVCCNLLCSLAAILQSYVDLSHLQYGEQSAGPVIVIKIGSHPHWHTLLYLTCTQQDVPLTLPLTHHTYPFSLLPIYMHVVYVQVCTLTVTLTIHMDRWRHTDVHMYTCTCGALTSSIVCSKCTFQYTSTLPHPQCWY